MSKSIDSKCQATHGQPTSMSKTSWDKLCRSTKRKANNTDTPKWEKLLLSRCLNCPGKPKELTIINLQNSKPVANEVRKLKSAKRIKGICAHCGEDKPVKTIESAKTCASCEAIISIVKEYPELAGKFLKKYSPDLFQVSADVSVYESEIEKIKEVANEAVSEFRAENSRLIVEVEQLKSTIDDMKAVQNEYAWKMADGLNSNGQRVPVTWDDVMRLRDCGVADVHA